MSLWGKIGMIISVLMVLDGLACLLFLEKIEGWIKSAFPRVNLAPIAALEILLGGILGMALLWWR